MSAAIRNWASDVRRAALGERRLRPEARSGGSWLALTAALAITLSNPTFGLGAERTGPVRGTPDLEVTIRVYNYSDASPWRLEHAEREATQIISRTGITTNWLDCGERAADLQRSTDPGCGGPVGGTTLVLRVLPGSAPAGDAFNNEVSGYAIGSVLASVFYGRVEQLSHSLDSHQRETPVVLGHVIAHEIGHVLLGTNSHSTTGIMCNRWDLAFLRKALMGSELFLPEQSAVMRANVLHRHEDSTAPPKPASNSE